MTHQKSLKQAHGVMYAIGAYLCWGLFPLYWKPLHAVAPLQILCHRISWSAVFLLLLLMVRKDWQWLEPFYRQPGKLVIFAVSSLTLSLNWLLYIWAVNSNHVVESSLGYFINPLVSVLLGRLVLKERLNELQMLAVLLAASGVLWMSWQLGSLPWISLGLALTFGLYGLLRKQAPLPAIEGLALESFMMAPLALGALLYFEWAGSGCFGHVGFELNAMLLGAGVVTAVPLILFAQGAHRLKLATLGLIQYISPSLQLLLGVLIYHENFDSTRVMGFALIWAGLLVYTFSSLRNFYQKRLSVQIR